MTWNKKSGLVVDDRSKNLIALINSFGIAAYDSFDRPDTDNLGKTDTKQLWHVITGNFRIREGRLETPHAGLNLAYIDVGLVSYEVSFDSFDFNNFFGVAFRIVDENNYLMCRISATGVELYRVLNNAATKIGDSQLTGSFPKRITTRVDADLIEVTVNGEKKLTVNDSNFLTASRVGVRSSVAATGVRSLDNFEVKAL